VRMSRRNSSVVDVVKGATSTVRRASVRRASNAFATAGAIATAISPGNDNIGFDVLGLAAPSPGGGAPATPGSGHASHRGSIESNFDDNDIFEVDVIGEGGDLSPMIAGHGITSPVLRDGAEDGTNDWAAEMLLLTHEPMRRDMLEMQRALQAQYFGNLPESWRVRAFFRFFGAWCSLVSQQHAVEVYVHYDWLAAPTGKMEGEHRSELLSYHRAIELELLAISRLEKRIIEELREAADWTTSEPWSAEAQLLRERVQALCAQIRMHLATQESLLPELLREHWGSVAPPQLVMRALEAAKKAQAQSAKSRQPAKLLNWILHYLQKREPARADKLVAALPMMKRLSIAFKGLGGHAKLIAHLRNIIDDTQPREDEAAAPVATEPSDAGSERTSHGAANGSTEGAANEKARRAGMVNAVLNAANARRLDVPINDTGVLRNIAESRDPLHTFKGDSRWAERQTKLPDSVKTKGIWKMVGIEEPEAPRRP